MVIYYKTLITTAMGMTVVQVQNNQSIEQQYDNTKLAETLV